MTKLKTKLLKDLPVKTTPITEDDYVVNTNQGTTKLKVKDITKDVTTRVEELESALPEVSEQLYNMEINKATKIEVDVERKRIDNLISNNNPTEGNSELVDMRVDSQGVIHSSGGEHIRYLEKTSSLLYKMGATHYETNDKNANQCQITNTDNYIYSYRVTHTAIPNYSYNIIKFKDKVSALRNGVKKFKLVLQSDRAFELGVALNNKTNWANGLMWKQVISLQPGKYHYVDIDLNTPKVKTYLDDEANNSGELCLFIIYRGSDGDAVIGKYNITAYLMTVAEDNQPQSFSEVSGNSLTSGYALLAENSNYAYQSLNALNAGIKIIPEKDCTSMNGNATLERVDGTAYRLTKLIGVGVGTTYGLHLYIPYKSLSELKNRLFVNPKLIKGEELTSAFIVANKGDWNPDNKPIGVNVTKPINLYEVITNCDNSDYKAHYQKAKFLYVVYAFHSSNIHEITNRETILEITPYIEINDSKVLATHVTPEASTSIVEKAIEQGTRVAKGLIAEVTPQYTPLTNVYWGTTSSAGWVSQNATKVGNSYVIKAEHNAQASHCCIFDTGLKQDGTVKDVTILYKSKTPNGFVSVGLGFSWSSMNTLDIKYTEGSDYYVANISASHIAPNMPVKILVGTKNGETIDMDIIYIVNYKDSKTLITDYAVSSGRSIQSANAKYSEQAKNSEHAEISNMSKVSQKAMTTTNTLSWVATNHKLTSNRVSNATTYGKDSIKFDELTGECEVKIEKGNESWAYVNGVELGSKDFLRGKKLVVYIQDIPNNNDHQISLDVFNISSSQASWSNAINLRNQIKIGQLNILDLDSIINEPKFNSTPTLYFIQGIQKGHSQSLPGEVLTNNSSHYRYKIGLINPNELSTVFADSLKGFNATDYYTKSEMEERLQDFVTENEYEEYITCWGDSLTAMGGWTQKLAQLTGLPVYNGGTGGETSKTIMARQGGDVMLVNNITIPSAKSPVTLATMKDDKGISTYFGNKVTPLLQGGGHMNPCTIGDVEGTLRWTGSSHADTTGIWTFTRNNVGEEVVINRPTALVTNYDRTKNKPKVMIIFIGQNGGWDNITHLIQQHRLMIEHSQCTDFLVLGLSSGSASSRKAYEDAMKNEFGRRFFSLRAYLSQYGLEDLGIEPTERDLSMMEQGITPQSLLMDSVHYTNDCRALIGQLVYKQLKELNMI